MTKPNQYTAHTIDLEDAILSVLGTGAANAITRDQIITRVRVYGHSPNERQVRAAIHDMRQEGMLICSSAGENPGYYVPATLDEMINFLLAEIEPRIKDLAKTKAALEKAARARFGDAAQRGLF